MNACAPNEGLRALYCVGACDLVTTHRTAVGSIEFNCAKCGTRRLAPSPCRPDEVPPWAAAGTVAPSKKAPGDLADLVESWADHINRVTPPCDHAAGSGCLHELVRVMDQHAAAWRALFASSPRTLLWQGDQA